MPIDDTVDVELQEDVQCSPHGGIPCPTGVVIAYQYLGLSATNIGSDLYLFCVVNLDDKRQKKNRVYICHSDEAMAVTHRMRCAAFICNRHPLLCSVKRHHPFCVNHPRLCEWWNKLVRTHHTNRGHQWRPGVGINGLWCVRKTQKLGGPFRLDLRVGDQCKLATQLSQCRSMDRVVTGIPVPVCPFVRPSGRRRGPKWKHGWCLGCRRTVDGSARSKSG